MIVAVGNRLQNLFNDDGGFSFGKLLSVNDLVKQFSSLAKFSNKENLFFVLKDFVKPDDVGMV